MHRRRTHTSFSLAFAALVALVTLAALAREARAQPAAPGAQAPRGDGERRGGGDSDGDSSDGAGAGRGGEVIIVPPVETRTGSPRDLVTGDSEHGDRARGLGESGFTTVVRVDQHAGETVPLAEALAETVGVHVRSLGGLGGFSSISVRGAATGQTAVLVDGVPLARLGSASADLGRFDLDSFSLVRLHRGAVPAALGGAPSASALELVTELGPAPDAHPLLLSVGGGSFGARHLRARWLGGGDHGGYHLGLGYAGAEGDFVYFNDNGTNLNRSDDRFVARQNNGYDRIDAVARAALRRGAWSLSGGTRGMWREQGVPGSGSVQSRTASLATWSQMADGTAVRDAAFGSPALTARASAQAMVELERYRDLDGEIGIGTQNRRYVTASAGASGTLLAELSPANASSATISAGTEVYRDRDLAAGAEGNRARGRGLRLELASTLAHTVRLRGAAGDRARIEPAVRLDLSRTTPMADPSAALDDQDLSPRVDVHVTPRAAFWLGLAPDLSLKASAGGYLRSPTALELYGDRGILVGNPSLRPETGESADLGLVGAPAAAVGPVDRVYLEAVAFAARSRDTIVWVPNAALVAGPQNLGSALVWGGELVASARAARALTVTADYTYLDSRQSDTLPSYDGKELPQRPHHQLHGRADLAGRAASRLFVVFADAALVSGNHLDPANLNEAPPRALLGAGVKLEVAPRLFVVVDGKNLTDARVEDIPLDPPPRPDLTRAPRAISDFFGYPLPGRAFYLTLQWEP
ncbi:MAG TPA: TonB-dependent receptor [Kofleriaceae bacterium]|nr:TonB-dependent receptor [Kofleriaceae bacterium]